MIASVGRFALGGFAAALLVAAACLPTPAAAQLPSAQLPSLAPMIERVAPAVVNISVSGRVTFDSPLAEDPIFRRFFPDGGRPIQSAGSGVIVDAERGYILTNHHVVASADRITVTLFDNRALEARVIGSDQGSDIAVLRIDAENLAEIELGDSDSLRVGDFVVAIGNPFGLSHTVTSGIVSGLGRSNITPDSSAYEDFIQTDASINPGNSGGALVGLDGRLVGINSAILSRGNGNIGIGFAIPVNMARYVMDQLVASGSVSRGALGVVINTLTPDLAAAHGLADTSGAVVRSVNPNSAAESAGLKTDDVIISVNGDRVRDAGSLRNAIGLLRPGERVMVGIVRNGREQVLEATLGTAEAAARALVRQARPDGFSEDGSGAPILDGVQLFPAGGEADSSGLLVGRVENGSLAAERGLESGDLITHINRQRVRSIADAEAILGAAETVTLEVRRGRRTLSIELR